MRSHFICSICIEIRDDFLKILIENSFIQRNIHIVSNPRVWRLHALICFCETPLTKGASCRSGFPLLIAVYVLDCIWTLIDLDAPWLFTNYCAGVFCCIIMPIYTDLRSDLTGCPSPI